jgi:hypothetical protein
MRQARQRHPVWGHLANQRRRRYTRVSAILEGMLLVAETAIFDDDNPARRDKIVSVRFSTEEFRGIQERAEKAHMSVSDYIRIRMDYNPLMYRTTHTYPLATTSTTYSVPGSYTIIMT